MLSQLINSQHHWVNNYNDYTHGQNGYNSKARYRIAQNFGKVKLWQIGRFRILARKTLVNTQIGHGNFGEIT